MPSRHMGLTAKVSNAARQRVSIDRTLEQLLLPREPATSLPQPSPAIELMMLQMQSDREERREERE
jgi:hypothetical protein